MDKNKTKRAVAYVRVSTSDQHLGPAAQLAVIKSWCAREGVELAAVYEENVSGGASLDRRVQLMGAIDAITETGAELLIVAKRDRLARDTMVSAMVERLVERKGATIVSADGVGNGSLPEQKLMRQLVAAFAEYERAIIRARTKAALGVKKARGERLGAVPFGFKLAADGVHLERHDAEAEVVDAIKSLRASGLSMRKIVDHLSPRFTSRSGRPLGLTQVARIVKREAS